MSRDSDEFLKSLNIKSKLNKETDPFLKSLNEKKIDKVPDFPSLADQGKNMTELLAKFVESQMEGNQIFAPVKEQKRRYDMCQVCEHFVKHAKRCRKCGCYMKHKVKLEVSECPIHKW